MSDELGGSSPAAFCAESVATFDTVRKTPAARFNLCAFPVRPQGKRHAMVNRTDGNWVRLGGAAEFGASSKKVSLRSDYNGQAANTLLPRGSHLKALSLHHYRGRMKRDLNSRHKDPMSPIGTY